MFEVEFYLEKKFRTIKVTCDERKVDEIKNILNDDSKLFLNIDKVVSLRKDIIRMVTYTMKGVK